MIERLKALMQGDDGTVADGASHDESDLQIASAALLVEAAAMDGHVDDQEAKTISALLENQFDLAAGEAAELFEAGRNAVAESHQLYGFTRVIKDQFSHDERVRVMEMLWEVVYADGELHAYESNLVRRVAGLIYVADRESGEARKRVLARIEENTSDSID